MKNINQEETVSTSLAEVIEKLNKLIKLYQEHNDDTVKQIEILESELIKLGGSQAKKLIEVLKIEQ